MVSSITQLIRNDTRPSMLLKSTLQVTKAVPDKTARKNAPKPYTRSYIDRWTFIRRLERAAGLLNGRCSIERF